MNEIKSWKKERIRRHNIRVGKKWREQMKKDLDIWCDRVKEATLQQAMLSVLLDCDKKHS